MHQNKHLIKNQPTESERTQSLPTPCVDILLIFELQMWNIQSSWRGIYFFYLFWVLWHTLEMQLIFTSGKIFHTYTVSDFYKHCK